MSLRTGARPDACFGGTCALRVDGGDVAPYICSGPDGGIGTCTRALGDGVDCRFINTACRNLPTCDLRFVDGGLAATCVPESAVGGPCAPGEPATCANGYCDGTTCQAYASFGDPCVPDGTPVCSPNLTCVDDVGNGNFVCLDECPCDG